MSVFLVMKSGDGRQRVFRLRRAVNVIGRSHRCDLRLPLPSVAMRHCQICIEDERVTLINQGPPNGLLLNGDPVDRGELASHDTIQIGPVLFEVIVDWTDEIPGELQKLMELKPPADKLTPTTRLPDGEIPGVDDTETGAPVERKPRSHSDRAASET